LPSLPDAIAAVTGEAPVLGQRQDKGAEFMMAAIIRQVPGVIGAIAAYIVLKLLWWLFGFQSIAGEVLILVAITFAVALLAERAMRKYQQSSL
jgi:hypothetical protein